MACHLSRGSREGGAPHPPTVQVGPHSPKGVNPARHARLRLCVAPRRFAVSFEQGLTPSVPCGSREASGRRASLSPRFAGVLSGLRPGSNKGHFGYSLES